MTALNQINLGPKKYGNFRKMKLSFAVFQRYHENFAFVPANFAIDLTLNESIYVLLLKISIS